MLRKVWRNFRSKSRAHFVPGDFLDDESGQATTEYILLLAIAVGLATIVIREFLRPAFTQLTEKLTQRLERGFFGDMHHFPVRR